MGRTEDTQLLAVKELLDHSDPNQVWLRILETFLPSGIADMIQIQRFTGLDRETVRRTMKKFEKSGEGLHPILKELNMTSFRAGAPGRSPQIYQLLETGAGLLRLAGKQFVRPSKLEDPDAINHAVLMLDIFMEARRAGYAVICDKPIPYGDNRSIRPDNLVQLSENSIVFESEQTASPKNIHRIIESLENKTAFFLERRQRQISPDIRMVVNAAQGAEYEKTIRIWRQAYAIVSQKRKLPFRLFAIPHLKFLNTPDFQEPLISGEWEEISKPGLVNGNQNKSMGNVEKHGIVPMPKPLIQQSSSDDDRLILLALWQLFNETAGTSWGEIPKPDPRFLELMQIIYLASHGYNNSIMDRASVPWASLYLLRHYLMMHPDLLEMLQKNMQRGGTSLRWNPTTILHRMQVVIDAFMAYHGWNSRGVLHAFSTIANYIDEFKTFGVKVQISNSEVLMVTPDGIIPGKNETDLAEESLAWVLFALFAYSPYLKIPAPAFW